MAIRIKFNLKEPQSEESLLLLLCRWDNQQIKLSTRQRVIVETWDAKKQLCITSKEKYPARINRLSKKINAYLEQLSSKLTEFYDENYSGSMSVEQAKTSIKHLIDDLVEEVDEKEKKLKVTPISFFESYVERKRIDPHTGRYISERTKLHQRTVIHRLKSFLQDNNLPDEFSIFTSKRFDAQFSDWGYSVKKYKQNTVYATYGVLKPLLNAAKEEGYEVEDYYKHLKCKCVDTDAIYLTEEEIKMIYKLDIPKLIEEGEVDSKSTMEKTRDLFIISRITRLHASKMMQKIWTCQLLFLFLQIRNITTHYVV